MTVCRLNATRILTGAEDVNTALESTNVAQENAQTAINKALEDIGIVKKRLEEV